MNYEQSSAVFQAILNSKERHKAEVCEWINQLVEEGEIVAARFNRIELIVISAVYEAIPWSVITNAKLTAGPGKAFREGDRLDSNASDEIQHILAYWMEYFSEPELEAYDGVEVDNTVYGLLYWFSINPVRGTANRIRELSSAEAVALVVMLEAAKAIRGVHSYPHSWTPRALLGMAERTDNFEPWKTGSGDCIDFAGNGWTTLDDDDDDRWNDDEQAVN